MRRRSAHIPLRAVIMVGCEGRSEMGYAALLQRLANEAGLAVHLKGEELHPGAGDPLGRMEMMVGRLKSFQKKRTRPEAVFVLLDRDQVQLNPERAARATQMAEVNCIQIVWQSPCLEAVLLRHLARRATSQPPDSQSALRALRQEWPDYQKPMDMEALRARIDLQRVRQAAAVEPELAQLIRAIGLIP